ncbi:hypothetical protein [Halotia branconii]|uniref:Uncharacterized protein n=1 Tax=Halotia branconii CENA392 TaxID=1539056 RepID=A0AAJ6NNY1_9CYAN|nr:hypothetical protein [Halotia branconii]WGV23960.1 hypothetical protein QI031_19385 [Halotia branconii CENA392]
MTRIELKNHPVWQYLTEILENLNTDVLVKEHLKLCDYQICGYWDEQDEYYEIVTLPRTIETELVSSSIGVTYNKRFLQLKFFLIAFAIDDIQKTNNNFQKVGKLVLIYDENLEFIDENFILDIDSPMLTIKRTRSE